MSRKSPNLTLSLPRCGNCGRHWRPKRGVIASQCCCAKCAKQRRVIASVKFGLVQVPAGGLGGAYLLPPPLRDA